MSREDVPHPGAEGYSWGMHSPDLAALLHHFEDETDAAYLYRVLAQAEPDAKRQDLYRRLADVEDRHAAVWKKILQDQGTIPAPPAPRAGPG